ncbi:MAG TPA: HAMP domain-containing protein [Bacteroidetes bacterium]|nr:HAMP domain-containing protein [Bacteroidota bacterium]
MTKFYHSLSFRVFLIIVLITASVLAAYIYYLHVQEQHIFMTYITACAKRFSNVIKKATRHGMLLNRRQDVFEIIQNIGQQPGVEGIRVFNKRGEIVYSTDPSEVGKRVDMKAESCVDCHRGPEPIRNASMDEQPRIFRAPDGHRVLGMASSIRNEPACYNAACHAHSPNQKLLGVLDIRMDLSQMDQLQAAHARQATLAGLIAALLSALAGGLLVRLLIHNPVHPLAQGTEEIARGNLGYTISLRRKDELGALAARFNKMSQDLKRATDEIRRWSETLEQRVQEKTEELEKAQAQILQAERMASLGKMAATVAHELNNPMSGILGLAKVLEKRIRKLPIQDEQKESLIEDLRVIQSEAKRLGNIVQNLLVFARGGKEELSEVDLNQAIEKALVLVSHHLELKGVRLETQLCPKGCWVIGNEDQLKQVFMALLVNAVEAMPNGGVLSVRTHTLEEEGKVQIEVSDTGVGIPPDALPHIFEPFFTTKSNGGGLGLGLAVVYGIVQKHRGEIRVKSEVGKGTTFVVELPFARRGNQQTAEATPRQSNTV